MGRLSRSRTFDLGSWPGLTTCDTERWSLTTPPLAHAPRDGITACEPSPHSDHRSVIYCLQVSRSAMLVRFPSTCLFEGVCLTAVILAITRGWWGSVSTSLPPFRRAPPDEFHFEHFRCKKGVEIIFVPPPKMSAVETGQMSAVPESSGLPSACGA